MEIFSISILTNQPHQFWWVLKPYHTLLLATKVQQLKTMCRENSHGIRTFIHSSRQDCLAYIIHVHMRIYWTVGTMLSSVKYIDMQPAPL